MRTQIKNHFYKFTIVGTVVRLISYTCFLFFY